MDTLFNRSPVTNNGQGDIVNVTSVHFTISPSQGDIASVTSEMRISLDMLSETINGFNELKNSINNKLFRGR